MYLGGSHRWVPLRLANKVLDVKVIETVAAKHIPSQRLTHAQNHITRARQPWTAVGPYWRSSA